MSEPHNNNDWCQRLHVIYSRANMAIEHSMGSKESKTESRKELRKLFGSIAVRAIIIGSLHLKTSMLPPLLVSSIMAVTSVLENQRCEAIMLGKKAKKLHSD